MQHVLKIARALSDENRIRILLFLHGTELCVCQIISLLGLAPSTVSKHITVLTDAGLLESRKEGRWHYYRLPGPSAAPAVTQALQWVSAALRGNPSAADDAKRLKSVMKEDVKKLCDLYKN